MGGTLSGSGGTTVGGTTVREGVGTTVGGTNVYMPLLVYIPIINPIYQGQSYMPVQKRSMHKAIKQTFYIYQLDAKVAFWL
jgi:hypothetical protein